VVRTVETAGRTVAVSALTVAVSLSALLVFPLYFLRSFASAGIGVTVVSAAASLLTLPALLAVLGRRVDSLRLWKRRSQASSVLEHGMWHRIASAVMRRPVIFGGAAVAILLFLGAPFLGVRFGTPDERVLPEGAESRIQTERLSTEFSSDEADAFPVVALNSATDADVDATATALSTLPGVGRVDAVTGRYLAGQLRVGPDPSLDGFRSGDAVRFNLVPTVAPVSPDGEAMVKAIRAAELAVGEVLVGGRPAQLVDTKAAIVDRLPLAIGLIGGSTFILLFLMFGSILVPIKAIVLNLL